MQRITAIRGAMKGIIAFLAGEDKSCLDNGGPAGTAGIVVAEGPIIMSVCESPGVAGLRPEDLRRRLGDDRQKQGIAVGTGTWAATGKD